MSKHKSRKSRWHETSPTCFVSSCGSVTTNSHGKWDATLKYKQRLAKKGTPEFLERHEPIGEYKRAREAMMAVEDHAKELLQKQDDNVIIVIEF